MSKTTLPGAALIAAGALSIVCGFLYIMPLYDIYSQENRGKAELARAEYSKQVAVQTAKAKLEAAALEAQTDIRRAEGVAQANKIVADSLGGPEGYLRWKYIEMLETTSNAAGRTIIYVPTEAGLPVLEAGRAAQGRQP